MEPDTANDLLRMLGGENFDVDQEGASLHCPRWPAESRDDYIQRLLRFVDARLVELVSETFELEAVRTELQALAADMKK